MTPSLAAILLVVWLVGRPRKGEVGGLAGLVLGLFLAVGIVRDALTGDLARLYTPAELALAAVPLIAAGTITAVLFPSFIAFVTTGWGAGAVVAVVVVLGGELDTRYAFPLLAHTLGAGLIAGAARWRRASSIIQSWEGQR